MIRISGLPWFGSIWSRFGRGTVRAIPVLGSDGSSGGKAFSLCISAQLYRKVLRNR